MMCVLILVSCNNTQEEQNNTELTIYTSIYPIQYITKQIAGDLATVSTVYPPGVDAHSYEPTSRKITEMAYADAFIYLGAGMEGFAEATANALQSHPVSFIEIGKHDYLFDQSHGDIDPHIWLDPVRMIDISTIITNKLIDLKPEYEEQFKKNEHTLTKELEALDQEFKDLLIDKTDKDILVAHGAYGYWEKRYGIKQIPISGISSEGEPSQKELAKLVTFAADNNVKYVIYEQNSSDRVTEIIQDYLQAEALQIHNLEVLTENDLNKEEDYFSLMRKNLITLDRATK